MGPPSTRLRPHLRFLPAVASAIVAWLTLLVMHAFVRLASFATLKRVITRVPALWQVPSGKHVSATIALVAAVRRARRVGPSDAKCLSAAATCAVLLRARGLPAEVVIGVRNAPFEAHAWTELYGAVVDDDASVVSNYAAITRI